MRHLGSILLAALVAPLILVLVGRGVGGYLETVAEPPVDPVAAAFALASLGLGGLLYAVLALARFSPLGPVLAGLGYLALGGWLLADPAALPATVPAATVGLTDEQLVLSATIAPLLAIPLVITLGSGRRWRGHDPVAPAGQHPAGPAPTRHTQEFATPPADWPPVPTGQPAVAPATAAEPYGPGAAYSGVGYPRLPVTGYGDYPSGAYPGVTTRVAAAGRDGSEPTVPSVYGNEAPKPPAAYGYLPPQRGEAPPSRATPLPTPPGAVGGASAGPAVDVAEPETVTTRLTATDGPTVALRPEQPTTPQPRQPARPRPSAEPAEDETTAAVRPLEERTTAAVRPPADRAIAASTETAEPIPITQPPPPTHS